MAVRDALPFKDDVPLSRFSSGQNNYASRTRGFSMASEGETLLKTDKATVALEAQQLGKIRLQVSALLDGAVILEDQIPEVRWRQGQLHLMRLPRVPDAIDRAFVEENADSLGEA